MCVMLRGVRFWVFVGRQCIHYGCLSFDLVSQGAVAQAVFSGRRHWRNAGRCRPCECTLRGRGGSAAVFKI